MITLGSPDFSWYCFYDRRQSIYLAGESWEPPFQVAPMNLDINLRNTRAIGEFSAQLGQCPLPATYRVEVGESPVTLISQDFAEMAGQLRQVLRKLLRQEALTPQRIVGLAPYRHTNPQSGWAAGLDEFPITTEMIQPPSGHIRVGTIQG